MIEEIINNARLTPTVESSLPQKKRRILLQSGNKVGCPVQSFADVMA